MQKLTAVFIRLLEIVTATMFVVMFLTVTLQIAARNLLDFPVIWTEELARFLYVWVTFLGAVIITRDNDHIRIDYIGEAAPFRLRAALGLLADILSIIFTISVLRGGFLLVSINHGMPLASMSRSMTFAHLYSAVPVGMSFVLLFLLVDLSRNIRRVIQGEEKDQQEEEK